MDFSRKAATVCLATCGRRVRTHRVVTAGAIYEARTQFDTKLLSYSTSVSGSKADHLDQAKSRVLLHLPVLWMGLVIFAIIYLMAGIVFCSTTKLVGDRRAVDPGFLSPLGVVFGLLVVFTAAQVWGDLERARTSVAEEASALRDVLLLANGLSESENAKLRLLVRSHIVASTNEEWPAMAQGHAVVALPTTLRRALQEVIALPSVDALRKPR